MENASLDKKELENDRPLELEESGREGIEESHEPKTGFSRLTILSMAVTLMATWEALSSTMVSGLVSGGPVSLVYGFLLALIGGLATAASLGEMASMCPTAGGQYHFTAQLAPDRWRNILSWATGWTATFGWVAFTASAPFLAAGMIQGMLVLDYETYTPQRWHATLIYWAFIAVATVVNIWGTRLISAVQNVALLVHVVAFLANFVVVWACSPAKHSASFVFTFYQNGSGWSSGGVAWCIGMLSSCYVLVGYDGAIHLGEEMMNPPVDVPFCMLGSLVINGILGFAFLLALLFCMGDVQTALESGTGYPIIQIFYSVTGSSTASSAMTSTLVLMAGMATIPLLASTGRMLWSLANDRAFPFWRYFSRVDRRSGIPRRSIIIVSVILTLLGLINIGSTTAFNAIISLAIFGLHISYLVPLILILWRRMRTAEALAYGPWKLGRSGVPINIISIIYLLFTCTFMVFPPYQPVTPVNMNYASLIFGAMLILSAIYWAWRGRKEYCIPINSCGHVSR